LLNQHFRNASWGGFSAAFRAVYGLLNVLLSIRLLGVDHYGDIATLLAFFIFYASLNSSIYTVLVVKLMAKDEGNISLSNKAVKISGLLLVFISILFLFSIVILLEILAPSILFFKIGFKNLILAFAVLISTQIFTGYFASLIEGSGRMDLSTKAQLFGPFFILTSLFFAFIFEQSVNALIYAFILCIGAFLDLCVTLFIARKNLPSISANEISANTWLDMWILLRNGSLLQATSLMNMFLEPLNKFLLNSFLGASAVTFYELGMKLIWGIQSLFNSALRVFLHMAGNDKELISEAYSIVIRLICVPAILLHTICVLFLALIARYWLKTYELDLFFFFAIAMLSNFGMILVLPLYSFLVGNEDLLFIFNTQVRLAIINILTSLALIPILGLIGAAFGLLIATLFNVLAIINKTKKLLNFNSFHLNFKNLLWVRIIAGFLLLILSLVWACLVGDNQILLAIICMGIVGLTIQDPIFAMLIKEFKRSNSI